MGRLAQLEEHFVYTEGVGGSSPSPPTNLCGETAKVVRRSLGVSGQVVVPHRLASQPSLVRAERRLPRRRNPEGEAGPAAASYGSATRLTRQIDDEVLTTLESVSGNPV